MEIKHKQYFGAIQLTLDEYLDLVVEGTSDETATTSNDEESMQIYFILSL